MDYQVEVRVPSFSGGDARAYAGTCTLSVNDERIILTKKRQVGEELEEAARWNEIIVLNNQLEKKHRISIRIRFTDFEIKLNKDDSKQLASLLSAKMEERRCAITARIDRLPLIAPKKAAYIERTFSVWSVLLQLWLLCGFAGIFMNFGNATSFSKGIESLKSLISTSAPSSIFTVKPEYAEMSRQVAPWINWLEMLQVYYWIVAIVFPFIWFSLIQTRKLFIARDEEGPVRLFRTLVILFAIYGISTLLTISIPPLPGLGDLRSTPRIAMLVYLLIMLTLIPFFGKSASIYYDYTAIDETCFSKNGVGIELMKQNYDQKKFE